MEHAEYKKSKRILRQCVSHLLPTTSLYLLLILSLEPLPLLCQLLCFLPLLPLLMETLLKFLAFLCSNLLLKEGLGEGV